MNWTALLSGSARTIEAARFNWQDHPDTLSATASLARAYLLAGRINDALRLHEETLRLRRLRLGSDHTDTIDSMIYLAQTLQTAGRRNWREAITFPGAWPRLCRSSKGLCSVRRPPYHPSRATRCRP